MGGGKGKPTSFAQELEKQNGSVRWHVRMPKLSQSSVMSRLVNQY